MRIDRVRTFAVKIPYHDRFGGQRERPGMLPGGEYYFEDGWNEVYAATTQTLLVRLDTDAGVHGWGESQAPIVPEAAQAVIDRLLAPMLLGADPADPAALRDRMYRSMNGRGHFTGFMVDAIAGCDTALWDCAAKAAGLPLCRALGGPHRDRLSAYVSGLRASSTETRARLACDLLSAGYAGVKLYLGHGVDRDIGEAAAVRDAVGPAGRLLADVFWVYEFDEAVRLGHTLEALRVGWLESPLQPEAADAHARLARTLDIPIAAGETLRTGFQFSEWLGREAVDIAQPDVARCGVTEAQRIARLCAARDRPVALHLGVSLGVAMAATWHVAAALPDFLIQEHHPPMLDLANRVFLAPLRQAGADLLVPQAPGIGVDIDLAALEPYVDGRGDTARTSGPSRPP